MFVTNRRVRGHVRLHLLLRVHVLLPLLQSRVVGEQIALERLQLTKGRVGVGIRDRGDIGSHETLLRVIQPLQLHTPMRL